MVRTKVEKLIMSIEYYLEHRDVISDPHFKEILEKVPEILNAQRKIIIDMHSAFLGVETEGQFNSDMFVEAYKRFLELEI